MGHLRRPRHHGLRAAVRAGGRDGVPRHAGGGYRRRRELHHERAGVGDDQGGEPAGQDYDPQQPAPWHGRPVGGPILQGEQEGLTSHWKLALSQGWPLSGLCFSKVAWSLIGRLFVRRTWFSEK